jgi:hypothetical protein
MCEKLGKEPEKTQNQLKKTRNAQIEDMIHDLKNEQPSIQTITDTIVPTNAPPVGSMNAHVLHKLNVIASFVVEGVNDATFAPRTGMHLNGLAKDVDSMEQQLQPVYDGLVHEYPEALSIISGPLAQYVSMMGGLIIGRSLKNKAEQRMVVKKKPAEHHIQRPHPGDPVQRDPDVPSSGNPAPEPKKVQKTAHVLQSSPQRKQMDSPLVSTLGARPS